MKILTSNNIAFFEYILARKLEKYEVETIKGALGGQTKEGEGGSS